MKRRYYIIIAVASYMLFTLTAIPAASVYSLASDKNLPLKLYGIEGSIWNGRAGSAVIPRKPPVKQIRWQLNPFALLIARISASFDAEFNNQPIVGHIKLSVGGDITISDLKTSMAASEIAKLASVPLGEFAGKCFSILNPQH